MAGQIDHAANGTALQSSGRDQVEQENVSGAVYLSSSQLFANGVLGGRQRVVVSAGSKFVVSQCHGETFSGDSGEVKENRWQAI